MSLNGVVNKSLVIYNVADVSILFDSRNWVPTDEDRFIRFNFSGHILWGDSWSC